QGPDHPRQGGRSGQEALRHRGWWRRRPPRLRPGRRQGAREAPRGPRRRRGGGARATRAVGPLTPPTPSLPALRPPLPGREGASNERPLFFSLLSPAGVGGGLGEEGRGGEGGLQYSSI